MKKRILLISFIGALIINTGVSCRPAKCASLDAGDVKVTKRKKVKMSLFSKKELKHRKWK